MKTRVTTETHTKVEVNTDSEERMKEVAPKGIGMLDMVIAFDTTGSMAKYISDVRRQVAEMIPRIFKDNENLRLGIVAFGDYCDMIDPQTFGKAYQCLPLTNNENDVIKFVTESKNTNGGDGDEFYELVLKKIIEESSWRDGSSRVILLIADSCPHEIGYTYKDYDTGMEYVVNNQIDWRAEARKAVGMRIKIDTVTIHGGEWYKELSAMTNGISVPFHSSDKTGNLIETATAARSTMAFMESAKISDDESTIEYCRERASRLRSRLSDISAECNDSEVDDIGRCYCCAIDEEEEAEKMKDSSGV